MNPQLPYVDIHCHLLPGVDDGASSWSDTLAMARMAVADGTGTIIVTPHQLGNFAHNRGESIRQRTAELQRVLEEHEVPLQVLPGADVRIEDDMLDRLQAGDVVSLGDHRRHVLLELPHEMYFPLEPVLDRLHAAGMVGILSHPERNQGLLKRPELLPSLVEYGCLMQVTAGALMGTFGASSQQLSEWMLERDLAQFIASDAHGPRARRPLLGRAFHRVAELTDQETAIELCCTNPQAVAAGQAVVARPARTVPAVGFSKWLPWRKAA